MSQHSSQWIRKSLTIGLLALGMGQVVQAQTLDLHTRRNLNAAMHDEAYSSLRYRAYAEVARAQGDSELAKLFDEAASDESNDHFRREAEALGLKGPTPQNLQRALDEEHYDSTARYKRYAEEAEKAGDKQVAELFRKIAVDENEHFLRYQAAMASRKEATESAKQGHD